MSLILTAPRNVFEPETIGRRVAGMIGEYEVLEEIGRGHITAVCKARDLHRGGTVALKVILGEGLSEEQLQPVREALCREAGIAVRLQHPGVVSVMGIAEDSVGNPCIVMNLVEGETLEQALEPSPEPSPELRRFGKPVGLAKRLEMGIEIADALEYMHRCGVVHRDIKPSNVLLTEQSHPCIVDFGIATLMDGESSLHGTLPGTPAFVAPELLNDSPANACSDIFSFGVLLYWMFTGQIPFSGDTVTEIINNVSNAEPLPVQQHNWALPGDLDPVLARCLAKDPCKRYATARDLACDLRELRNVYGSSPAGPSGALREMTGKPRQESRESQDRQYGTDTGARRESGTAAHEGVRSSHPEVADLISRLAVRYHQEGRFAEAEELHCQALCIRESELGSWNEKVATSLNNLALLYRDQGRLSEAEYLLGRSLAIVERIFGTEHPKTALRLSNLADLRYRRGNQHQAEELYSRLARMLAAEQAGVPRREVASSLENYEALLRGSGRTTEANRIRFLIQAVRSRVAAK